MVRAGRLVETTDTARRTQAAPPPVRGRNWPPAVAGPGHASDECPGQRVLAKCRLYRLSPDLTPLVEPVNAAHPVTQGYVADAAVPQRGVCIRIMRMVGALAL